MLDQRDAARAEAERLNVQLAGCLVAAEGGTSEPVVAEEKVYGWSLAYQRTLDLRRERDHVAAVIRDAGLWPDDDNLIGAVTMLVAAAKDRDAARADLANLNARYQDVSSMLIEAASEKTADALRTASERVDRLVDVLNELMDVADTGCVPSCAMRGSAACWCGGADLRARVQAALAAAGGAK
jgi:hypothetical protein